MSESIETIIDGIGKKVSEGEDINDVLKNVIDGIVNSSEEVQAKLLAEASKTDENIEEVIPPVTGPWAQRLAKMLREYTKPDIHSMVKKNKKQYLLYTAPWKMAVKQVRSKQPPDYEVMTSIARNYGEVKKAMKRAEPGQVVCVIDIPLNMEMSALEIFYIVKS